MFKSYQISLLKITQKKLHCFEKMPLIMRGVNSVKNGEKRRRVKHLSKVLVNLQCVQFKNRRMLVSNNLLLT